MMKSMMGVSIGAALAMVSAVAKADPRPAGNLDEQIWTGTLSSVNAQDDTVTIRLWLGEDTFHLGKDCSISTLEQERASVAALRPGEEVSIRYRNVDGVLVADRVADVALQADGTVSGLNLKAGVITLKEAPLYRPFRKSDSFQIPKDCKFRLANGREGTLADLQRGDHLIVTYEFPGESPVAYRILDKSSTCTGTVVELNIPGGTLRAREGAAERIFALSPDCQVILAGPTTASFKGVHLGRTYRFTYEEMSGVRILERIAAAEPKLSKTAPSS
jgi:hypothetical protein